MADIAPFRGIRFDTSKAEAGAVLAPPYDVIDAEQWRRLAALHEHNCVRLILPEGEGDAKYDNAARTFDQWLESGVLIRDDKPAIYRYNQVFTSNQLAGREVTRRGFICAARLHSFDERVILPHERTLKGPKIDRLKLFKATASHPSQIFSLYSDPDCAADAALSSVESRDPDVDGTTADGTRHIMWRVDDEDVIHAVVAVIAERNLYIADGHHRYETMLAYRDFWREQGSDAADWGTLFLANMDDPGLIVLPTHRLVHSLASFTPGELRAKAASEFDVEVVTGAAADVARIQGVLEQRGEVRPTVAMIVPGTTDATLLSFRADLATATPTQKLDVTILHERILEAILGIDKAAVEARTHLVYVKDTAEALALTAEGAGQCCFLMNATPVADVKAVSDEGGFMPQKSTFFYPKIASGVVFRRF